MAGGMIKDFLKVPFLFLRLVYKTGMNLGLI